MTLALLSLGVIVFFGFVTGVSKGFYSQQDALAKRWSTRGVADLNAGHYKDAIPEFRAALLYSRNDFNFRLGLAQALMGLHRPAEAYSYLINLRTEHPENGLVNLELARISAEQDDSAQALRSYHNAIYGNWPGDQEKQEQDARFELVGYLLRINAKTQAESELISLAALVGDDPERQSRLGTFLLRIQDNERALAAFRRCLAIDGHNAAAIAGAGAAAFDLGRYSLAVRYLKQAVAANPEDAVSKDHLQIASIVLQLDPFQARIRAAQKYGKVVAAFTEAGDRLKTCPVAGSYATPGNSQQDLSAEWHALKPRVTPSGLRNDPDLVDTAMNLVFAIERQANEWCGGTSTPTDAALLRIANRREGS